MRDWLKIPPGALLVLGVITLLVAGGLGWATVAALQLEHEQLVARAEAEHAGKVRQALWRLDSYVAPLLVREDARPFDHFSTVFAPSVLLDNDGHTFDPGSIVQPSPLLHVELPAWMALHCQLDPFGGWQSPQVPSKTLRERLSHEERTIPMDNVTEGRCLLLERLAAQLPAEKVWPSARKRLAEPRTHDRTLVSPPRPQDTVNADRGNYAQVQNTVNPSMNYTTPGGKQLLEEDLRQRADFQSRLQEQAQGGRFIRVHRDIVLGNNIRNGENWFGQGPALINRGSETIVQLGSLAALWFPDRDGKQSLLALRLVKLENREFCQGVCIDVERLQDDLLAQIRELFPEAKLLPVLDGEPEEPLSRMTALPLQLDPGSPPSVRNPGWTTLRIGLSVAWVAAIFALVAIGLAGWSLLDLSERRIRFVSAVTHELRTPLTTLRLYLEMLLDGLVRDEKTRQEYLATLHGEAERLNRLVSNVLDYSRLEKQNPTLDRRPVPVGDLVEQVRATWNLRCETTGKQLVVESALPPEESLTTDGELVQQILGNLIDNACKYSREAADARVWLRVRRENQRLIFEVEDRGPGVAARDRRSIFRLFQRGRDVDSSTGGVGLGLSLARRWAVLLGGTLELVPCNGTTGACFRLTLPG